MTIADKKVPIGESCGNCRQDFHCGHCACCMPEEELAKRVRRIKTAYGAASQPLVPQQEPTTDERDLQDALMLLRIFLTRKNMATVDCLKAKVRDWMNRKGRQGSILREELAGVPSEQGTPPQEREFCEGCDHGVVAGKVCELCGGTGHKERRNNAAGDK